MGMTERPDTGLPASATRPSETLHRSLSLRNSHTLGFVTITPGYQVISWDTSFTASYIDGTIRHLIDGEARNGCNSL